MHKYRLVPRHIRPELSVLKLELHNACRLAIALGNKKQTAVNVGGNARSNQLVVSPHGHPALLQPSGCLDKNVGNLLGILPCGLPNRCAHVTPNLCLDGENAVYYSRFHRQIILSFG
jgi:hypothetical protein